MKLPVVLEERFKGNTAGNRAQRETFLIMLSRLRNLELETKKQVENMPITYDKKKDGLFLEGMKIGEKHGEKRGEKRGEKQGEKRRGLLVAEKLLKKEMPIQEVSEICSVPLEELEQILKKIHRGKDNGV